MNEVAGGRGHMPAVTYSYSVKGVTYHGSRIHLMDGSELPDQAHATIEDFPVEAAVQVYFNPRDPGESVLRPGPYWYSYAWFALSLGAIVVGTLGLSRSRHHPTFGAA